MEPAESLLEKMGYKSDFNSEKEWHHFMKDLWSPEHPMESATNKTN